MEYRSRRELREAEKAGLISRNSEKPTAEEQTQPSTEESVVSESPTADAPLTRRQMRELEKKGSTKHTPSTTQDHAPVVRTSDPKPNEEETGSDPAENVESDNGRIEPVTSKNYIYQESINTFTMDSIPDSLTTTNGDLVVTNSESITVVTGNHPSLSAAIDDLRYDSEDQKDTVAGKISLVDPVSAKLVAESREPEMIVPGKIVVRNRALSLSFALIGGAMFIIAGLGLWWALSEIGPFGS